MKKLLSLFLLTASLFAGINFDGTDDYYTVTDATHPTECSAAAWVCIDTLRAQTLVYRSDGGALPSGAFSHAIKITNAWVFNAYIYDGATKVVIGTTSLSADTWYHVAFTAKNSGNMRLYVNGVEEGSAAAIGTMWAGGTRYIVAGANASTANYFDGKIEGLCWWNKELTATEVAALAASRVHYHPTQIQPSSIRWYHPQDDFADGATVTGAGSIVDRNNLNTRPGTPSGSPIGHANRVQSYP